MVENLDSGRRARRTLQATALLMMLGALLIGGQSREAASPSGKRAGSADAPMPAPAAFLAAASRGGGSGAAQGARGREDVPSRDISERIVALSKVLSGAPTPAEARQASAVSAEAYEEPGSPGSDLAGRAEVVARLERGGAVYWLFSVRPEGRLLRAGVSSGPGPRPGAAPAPEPYLRRIDGRFELITDRGRYRVVEPPWEDSYTAVVGESP
jgi:hypothetical protein